MIGLTTVEHWAEALADLHARIAQRFTRSEARERAQRYLAGLLARVERQNGWQLAEALGEAGPQGVQRLLNAASWDADGVRDDLRDYVIEYLGDETTGVLIVDETCFLKKWAKPCGVAPQYTGTAGTTANCHAPRGHPGLPRVRLHQGDRVHRPRPVLATGVGGRPGAPGGGGRA